MLLIGGGSGMSPLWSILHDHVDSGEDAAGAVLLRRAHPARPVLSRCFRRACGEAAGLPFHSGALACRAAMRVDGETGFVHEVVARTLRAEELEGEIDAYSCGPPPMIDAVLPVLQMAGVEPERIYFDKFTPAVR